MPIVNCFVNDLIPTINQINSLVKEWAKLIDVEIKDISFNCIYPTIHAGQQYKVLINLYLPTIWLNQDVENIQLKLNQLLKKHLLLTDSDIFIITTMVQTGCVVDNGKIVKW